MESVDTAGTKFGQEDQGDIFSQLNRDKNDTEKRETMTHKSSKAKYIETSHNEKTEQMQ